MGESAVSSQEIDNREHISPSKTGDNIAAKKTAAYVWDPTNFVWSRQVTDTIAQALYDAIVRVQPLQQAIPYARDINDQMRVLVTSGVVTANGITWGNNGSYPTYYSTGAPNSVDVREELELQSINNFSQTRTRWSIT